MEISSERIDDIPVIVEWLKQMGIAKCIDQKLSPPHGNYKGMSYGQLSVLLLTYIITESDHRLCAVEPWVQAHRKILELSTGWSIGEKDASDDRLARVVEELGKQTQATQEIEVKLGRHLIRAYELPTEVARADTTSFSVNHQQGDSLEEGLLRYGYSKDKRPDLLQYRQLLATLDPMGMPLVSLTLEGNGADDPLYFPTWEKMVKVIGHKNFVFIADCKAGSIATRAAITANKGIYCVPVPMQGLAYEARRDYEDALKSYQQARKIAKENGLQGWEADILRYIGHIYTSRQDFGQALRYQEQALAIAKEVSDRSRQIQSLLVLGIVYKKLSRYEEALNVYQQAYTLAQEESDRGLAANLLFGIGTIYAIQKQYEQALNAYQQAQEATHNNPLAPFVNGINADNVEEFYLIAQQYSSNIGISALADSCTDALAYYGSDGLKQKFALDNINVLAKKANQTFLTLKGAIFHAIGQLYLNQESYSQAFTYYQQALPILHEAEAVMEGATLSDLAIVYKLQGQYEQALECSRRGLEISRAFNHRINEKDALYFLAIVYWAKGDISSTLDTLSQKAEVENETFALNLAIGSEERKRAYIAGQDRSIDTIVTFHLQAVPQNPEASKLAFVTVLQRKGRILDAVSDNIQRLRQNLQAEDQTLFDELSSFRNSLADLFYHKQNTLSAEEFKTQVAILQAKIEELEDTLAQRSIEFRTLVQPVTVEAVQALIPVDAALVEFVRYFPFNPKTSSISEAWGTPRYAVAILTHQENPKWIDLGETTPIDRAVKEFRDKLRNRQNQLSDLQESVQALHNLLIPRIQTELGDIRHLLIAPDSQLNLIPFAALVDSQNQYLGDIYTISYLTSGRDLLRSQVEGSDRSIQQDAAIIANPDLHGMHIETEAIASFLQNALLLKDSQAIKETLKQYSPTILHIAAHGFFSRSTDDPVLNENPLLRCGLVLAGDNTDCKDNEKVVLTALEVTGLNLRGTRLVVLSACETGLGGVLDGEGVYGLRRAFVIAGAESQMVSLWNVDDLPTTFLIINFYNRLSHQHSYPNLEAGSVAIALNQAQLWLKNLTKGNLEKWIEEKQLPLDPTMRMNLRRRLYKLEDDAKPFKSPFYWGAFCAISQ